jgi:hypothetical protein
MSKCKNYCDCCSHRTYASAETNEQICEVFGYEPPEEYMLDDDDECGCTCSEEQLKQFIREDNEA